MEANHRDPELSVVVVVLAGSETLESVVLLATGLKLV
jgi:hypothetical protein